MKEEEGEEGGEKNGGQKVSAGDVAGPSVSPPQRIFKCPSCPFTSEKEANVRRHQGLKHGEKAMLRQVSSLQKRLEKKKDELNRRMKEERKRRPVRSGREGISCPDCGDIFQKRRDYLYHLETEHSPVLHSDAEHKFKKIHSVFRGAKSVYRLSPPPGSITDALQMFRAQHDNGEEVLKYELAKKKVISFLFCATFRMHQLDSEGNKVNEEDISFPCPKRPLFFEHYNHVDKILDDLRLQLSARVSEFAENNGSGYIVDYLTFADISIFEGTLTFSGSSSLLTKKEVAAYLEANFNSMHAFEPVTSYNRDCFLYSVAQYFQGGKFCAKTGRRRKRKLCSRNELKTFIEEEGGLKSSIGSPPELMLLSKFETENSHLSFRVNIHMFDESQGTVFPYLRSKKSMKEVDHSIDLLLFDVGDMAHFVLISKLHLLSSREKRRKEGGDEEEDEDGVGGASPAEREIGNGPTARKKRAFTLTCPFCYLSFSTRKALANHETICRQQGEQTTSLPPPGTKKYFKDKHKRVQVDIFGAFDFETSMNQDIGNFKSTESNRLEEEMKAVTFSMAFVNSEGKILFQRTHSDDKDCLSSFFDALYDAKQTLLPLLNKYPFHSFSPSENEELKRKAANCYLCDEPFPFTLEEEKEILRRSKVKDWDTAENFDAFMMEYMGKVVDLREKGEEKGGGEKKNWKKPICYIRTTDHCHSTNKYLGQAHSICNLNRNRRGQLITLYAHNLSAFDGHLVLQGIGEQVKKGFNVQQMRLGGLCLNTEKLRTIRYDIFKMVDSCSFLDSSLENIVNDLRLGEHSFPLLLNSGLAANEEEKALLVRKGVFPYSSFRSVESFRKEKNLLPRESFFNDLTGEHISDEDYEHAQNVYKTFKCSSMLSYTEKYCALDVILLCEAIMQMRKTIYNTFKLELCSYISLPQLAQDAIFATNDASIDLLSDEKIYTEIEKQLRGGFSFVKTRYQEAASEKRLLYLDVNNLYGLSLASYIPCRNFERITDPEKISSYDWASMPLDGKHGFFVNCNLSYPSHLHEKHDNFPLAPELREIKYSDLSPYSKAALTASSNNPKGYKAKKLMGTFLPRKNYLTHFSNLQLYLEQGLVLDKVNYVVKFEQERLYAPFMEKCLKLRKEARSPFMKNVFKKVANSGFGKAIENQRKFLDCKFVSNRRAALKLFNSPLFVKSRTLAPDLELVFTKRPHLELTSLLPVGFYVLESSKKYMGSLYYNYVAKKCDVDQMSFSDTDSWCLSVNAPSMEKALSPIYDLLDCSNFSPSHPWYSKEKQHALGYLKEETGLKSQITKSACLKAKCYSLLMEPTEEGKKDVKTYNRCKGVKRNVVAGLAFEDYKAVLDQVSVRWGKQQTIRSYAHHIFRVTQSRALYSSFEDKNFILICGLHSRAYGHILTEKLGSHCERCFGPKQ